MHDAGLVRRARRRAAHRRRGRPAGRRGAPASSSHGRGARLRQAAAGHRVVAPAAAGPGRRPGRRPLPAHAGRRRPAAGRPRRRRTAAWWSSAPAGSAWRSPRPPAPRQRRSPWWSRSRPRCTRCSGPEMGEVFAGLHREHGVDLFTDTTVREFRGAGRVGSRWSTDGTRAARRLVVVGVGAVAEHRARRGGRARGRQRRGHRRALRTSAPDVFAAGDVAVVLPPAVRPARPGRALGERAQRRAGRRPVDARAGRRLRPGAVLLHRPVRPRHGVLRARPRPDDTVVCRGDLDGGEFIAFWVPGRAGDGRDERQRLGRHRADPGPDPVAAARCRPTGSPIPPSRWSAARRT